MERNVSAISFGAVTLDLPVILYFGGIVAVDGGIGIKAGDIRFIDERTMLAREWRLIDLPGWFVERTGKFREFRPKGKRREWARPLRFLWNFTLSEYDVALPRQVTVGELLDRVRDVKDHSREAPIASDLRRFLKEFDRDDVVTEQLLKAWPI